MSEMNLLADESIRDEASNGEEKYGPFLSIDDGWSRMEREIEELRRAVHMYRAVLCRSKVRDSRNKYDLSCISYEALQVATMAMRLRELAIEYVIKLDDTK